MNAESPHIPVLYEEVLTGLRVEAGGFYVDGTVGAGGHAEGILLRSSPDGYLLGLDVDPLALQICRERLTQFGDRVTLVRANFVTIREQVDALGMGLADGVLLDLGVSSMQLDNPARGFSFQTAGPLDMRMDPDLGQMAFDLVNKLAVDDLADLIYAYGEEPASRAIARAIAAARPIGSTHQLADVVSQVVKQSRIHPATRTFQALRIAVNSELERLSETLPAALGALKPKGRLAVISFHSLEDRIVKRFATQEARDCICPPEALVCTCEHRATLEIVTKKPIRPSDREATINPRSRSARLRIVARR